MTVPLLTNSKGQKFGKSEGNAVWINKSRTSNVHVHTLLHSRTTITSTSSAWTMLICKRSSSHSPIFRRTPFRRF